MVAPCFNPRNGLTVTQGEEAWDLVICFECLSIRVYLAGERNGAGLTIHADD